MEFLWIQVQFAWMPEYKTCLPKHTVRRIDVPNGNIAVGRVVMEQLEFDRVVEELTLLLIYLTSWREDVAPGGPGIQKAWKTMRFGILDALAEQGLIETNHTSKSLRITEAGLLKAEELRNKHIKV